MIWKKYFRVFQQKEYLFLHDLLSILYFGAGAPKILNMEFFLEKVDLLKFAAHSEKNDERFLLN